MSTDLSTLLDTDKSAPFFLFAVPATGGTLNIVLVTMICEKKLRAAVEKLQLFLAGIEHKPPANDHPTYAPHETSTPFMISTFFLTVKDDIESSYWEYRRKGDDRKFS